MKYTEKLESLHKEAWRPEVESRYKALKQKTPNELYQIAQRNFKIYSKSDKETMIMDIMKAEFGSRKLNESFRELSSQATSLIKMFKKEDLLEDRREYDVKEFMVSYDISRSVAQELYNWFRKWEKGQVESFKYTEKLTKLKEDIYGNEEKPQGDFGGFPMEEFHLGLPIEFEHTKDPMDAARIAIDHLEENPKYYTLLLKYVEK